MDDAAFITEISEPEFVAAGDGYAVSRAAELFKDGEHEFLTHRVVAYRLVEGKIAEIWTYDPDQAGMSRFYEDSAGRR